MTPTFRIAAIPGDGIGKEVLPEGLRVLRAAADRFDFALDLRPIDWASCDYYQAHGSMMSADWKEQLQGVDAIYFGAVGWPALVPDHVSLWGSLLKFRREFDQYSRRGRARRISAVVLRPATSDRRSRRSLQQPERPVSIFQHVHPRTEN